MEHRQCGIDPTSVKCPIRFRNLPDAGRAKTHQLRPIAKTVPGEGFAVFHTSVGQSRALSRCPQWREKMLARGGTIARWICVVSFVQWGAP
eukprot:5115341-Amphidinium_carterae.1